MPKPYSHAPRAAVDPTAFGVHSYHGEVQHYSGEQERGAAWSSEVWFQAPGQKRIVRESGDIAVRDGDRGWWLVDGVMALLDPTTRNAMFVRPIAVPYALEDAQGRLLGRASVAGRLSYALELTPRPDAALNYRGVTRARVWFDAQTYLPLRVEAWDGVNVLYSTDVYTRLDLNPLLDSSLFALTIPPNATLGYERPPAAVELPLLWAHLAGQVAYPLFRPRSTPPGFMPAGGPDLGLTRADWVMQSYAAGTPAGLAGLEVLELPATEAEPLRTGEPLQAGTFSGTYTEANGVRRLILQRDGMLIWLVGTGATTRDDLRATAALLEQVPAPAGSEEPAAAPVSAAFYRPLEPVAIPPDLHFRYDPSGRPDARGRFYEAYYTETLGAPVGDKPPLLEIREGPAGTQPMATGNTPVQIGPYVGHYSEDGPVRRLVVERDGTVVVLLGRGQVSRDALLAVASTLQPLGYRAETLGGLRPGAPATGGGALFNPHFVDARHGWVLSPLCGEEATCAQVVQATTDGGETWQARAVLPAGLHAPAFANLRDGVAYGQGLYATHDGGATWTKSNDGGKITEIREVDGALWRFEPGCGAASGAGPVVCGPVWRISRDGGRNWGPPTRLPATGPGWALVSGPGTEYWLLSSGNYGNPRRGPIGSLQASSDAGTTWHTLADPCVGTGGVQDKLAGSDRGHLWLLCGGMPTGGGQPKTLFRSSDGGAHWLAVATDGAPSHALPFGQIAGLAVSAGDRPWIVTVRPDGVATSRDGGHTWEAAIPSTAVGDGDTNMEGIQWVDARHGWVGTLRGLFRTGDGGQNWDLLVAH